MLGWRHKLGSVRERLHTQGVLGVAVHLAKKSYASLLAKKKDDDDWLVHKDEVDESFDSRYGIDTRGTTELAGLQIAGTNRLHGLPHIASDPDEFSAALAALEIDYRHFAFIDLGSGKGRALLLALRFPFRLILGVEFALEFHQIARANLKRVADAGTDVGRILLVHADATAFDLPLESLVLYLYNPFNDQVMKSIVERVAASYSNHPRPIYVVYAVPLLEKLWVDRGFAVLKRGGTFIVFTPPVVAAPHAE